MQEEFPKNQLKKKVRWDEQRLKQTEKNRGMFQKIDQPKTPYIKRHEDSDGEEQSSSQSKSEQQLTVDHSLQKAQQNKIINRKTKLDLNELNAKLRQQMEQYGCKEEEMDEQESEQKRKRKEEFAKKRAQHYNQFQMIQKMKKNGWQESDEQQQIQE